MATRSSSLCTTYLGKPIRALNFSCVRLFITHSIRFFPQTLQGADILAETLQARVIMPDFLKGQPWPVDKFPPESVADKAALQVFFGTTANPAFTLPYITAVGAELKKEGATKIGILGFCWVWVLFCVAQVALSDRDAIILGRKMCFQSRRGELG